MRTHEGDRAISTLGSSIPSLAPTLLLTVMPEKEGRSARRFVPAFPEKRS